MLLLHTVSVSLCLLSWIGAVGGQTTTKIGLADTELTLPCESSSADEIYQWTDTTPSNPIFIYTVENGVEEKGTDPKHTNFKTDVSEYPVSVPLIIEDILPEDEGGYTCTTVRARQITTYEVHVEALPTSVSVSCTSTPPDVCPESVGDSSQFTCTCNAVSAYPDDLNFVWTNAEGDPTPTSVTESNGRSGTFDYSDTATFTPTETDFTVTCSLGGYNGTWTAPNANYTFAPPGKCDISIVCNDDTTEATLTCSCPSGMPEDTIYTLYSEDGTTITSPYTVIPDEEFTVGCRACNGYNYGEDTFISKTETCTISTSTKPVTTKHNTHITTESIFTTTDTKINDPGISNCTGLITACSTEAVIIVALVSVIIYLIARERTGNIREDSSRSEKRKHGSDEAANRAYMDLQELGNYKKYSVESLQIPETNVKIYSVLPGNSNMLQYHKALVTRAVGNQDAVVKTLSAEATLPVIKILRSETQNNLRLTSDSNITKLLGWCDTVPNFILFKFIDGGTLLNHLKEEFSPHKEHTYHNTRRRHFQVSEKGNTEILPKYALQVARGISFLTKNKFVHPGLRTTKVLMDTTGNCKLYDFVSMENANEWIQLLWKNSVPFQWMPPEFLFLESISSAGDIWSFGVLLWEIFSFGSQPYEGKTRSNVEKQLRERELLPFPKNCPGAIWQLMLNCWESPVDKRPTIDAITAKLAPLCNEDKEYQEINPK